MHCAKVLLICSLMTCVKSIYVGSALFYNKYDKSSCWTEDEFAKLRARQILENIMPSVAPTDKVDKKYVTETIRYYREALNNIDKEVDDHTGSILREALADAIGGHLRARLLPTVRFAYYAGYIPCKTARMAHDFYDEVKNELNTLGLGWADPQIPLHTNLSVAKVLISTGKFADPCISMVSKRDANSCIRVPSPKLDDSENPSAIALPFKKGGLVSLSSPSAENILLNYYTTASRCILGRSPEKCRHADFVNFNNEMWHWMKRDVAPRLLDEKLYCAYGGVFRIAAAVQSYGKGLSRRNLYDDDDYTSSRWNFWHKLRGPCITLDSEWSPSMYVMLVFFLAVLICGAQATYYHIYKKGGCRCGGGPPWEAKGATYARVDSNIPALLAEHQSAVDYSEVYRKRANENLSKTRSISLGSMRTQKVLDMHDNTEKMMDVIMSGNEDSDLESASSSSTSIESGRSGGSVVRRGARSTPRAPSPPKLETPIAQLKLETPPRVDQDRRPMYTTSTATRSESQADFTCPGHRDSESTWSDTSVSDNSTSCSVSFKSQSRQSSSTRDLAWARRIVSKHSVTNKPKPVRSTTSDFDFSFTTPPSRR